MKEYLDRIGVEYRFQCYHEKRPDGCHRLADYLESFKRDWSRARSVYNMNCQENKYGPSCFKFGNYNLVGKAVAADFAEAYKSFLAGCDFGYGASCHNAGLMHYEAKIGEKRDFVKAVEFLERGCTQGNVPSCAMLSAYYITGQDGVPKDMEKAFKYALTSCDSGHMIACANLSRMYKLGEGVVKNMEMSNKYRRRALDIQKSLTENERPILSGG